VPTSGYKPLPNYLGKRETVIFQLYSTTILVKYISIIFYSIHYFKTVNYGSLLVFVTVNVQSDILPQLQQQQHLFQRWTALKQRIGNELIE